MIYRDAARDRGAGRGPTSCNGRGKATASASSSSIGGVASSAVLVDRDSCVGHRGGMDFLF